MPGVMCGVSPSARRRKAAAFSPADLDGLAAWFRADTGVVHDEGVVSQWQDRSGNGYHLTQATEALRPSLVTTGGPNDQPFLRFDGVDDYLRNATGLGAQPTHMFIVCVMSRTAPGTALTVTDGGTTNTRRINNPNATTTVNMFAGANLPRTGAASGATWQVIEALFNGASSKLRTHGTAYATGDAGAGANTGLVIGAIGGLNGFADCDVAELIVVAGALSPDYSDATLAYLTTRYAGGLA
jgi:hypothetical protein